MSAPNQQPHAHHDHVHGPNCAHEQVSRGIWWMISCIIRTELTVMIMDRSNLPRVPVAPLQ